jgi:hypothetical protein
VHPSPQPPTPVPTPPPPTQAVVPQAVPPPLSSLWANPEGARQVLQYLLQHAAPLPSITPPSRPTASSLVDRTTCWCDTLGPRAHRACAQHVCGTCCRLQPQPCKYHSHKLPGAPTILPDCLAWGEQLKHTAAATAASTSSVGRAAERRLPWPSGTQLRAACARAQLRQHGSTESAPTTSAARAAAWNLKCGQHAAPIGLQSRWALPDPFHAAAVWAT